MFYMVTVFGTGWTLLMLHLSWKAMRSSNWREADGKIMSVDVKEHVSNTKGAPRRYYTVAVACQYAVGGKTYETSRLSYGGQRSHGRRDAAEEEAKNYQPGSRITVYYDPDKPDDAVLKTGTSIGLWFGLCFGIIVLGFGVVGIIKKW
jgi:hypothetical protein